MEKRDDRRARKERDTNPPPSHTHGSDAGAIAGEIAGGLLGSIAGPPGAVAGMVIGAAAGALAGEVLDRDAQRAYAHDSDLDDEIGVTRGDLGSRPPPPPPPRTAKPAPSKPKA